MATFLHTATVKQTLQIRATFEKRFAWKNKATNKAINFTGCTARMQIRPAVDDPTLILELSTANGGIVLGTTDGSLTIKIPASVTATLTFKTATYNILMTMSDGITVWRMMEGQMVGSHTTTK